MRHLSWVLAVFHNESALIPKNSALIVRRIPAPLNGKSILAEQEMAAKNERYAEKPIDGADAGVSNDEPIAETAKTIEGADEADRIASLLQHAHAQIDQFPVPVRGGRRGGHRGGRHGHTLNRWGNGRFGGQHAERAPQPSSNYICHRCNQPGHWIDQCPTNGDPTYDKIKVRAPTGIPRSMLRQVEKPESGTGLKDSSGHFVTLQPNEEEFARQTVGLRLSNAGSGTGTRVTSGPGFRSPAQSGSISDVKPNESEEKTVGEVQPASDLKNVQPVSENDDGTIKESGTPNSSGKLPVITEDVSNGPQTANNRPNSGRPNHQVRHNNNRPFNQNQVHGHGNRRHNNGSSNQNNSQSMQTPIGLPVPPGMPPPGFPQVGMPFGPPLPPGLLMAMMAGMNPNAPNGMRAPNGLPGPLPPGIVPPFAMPFPPPMNAEGNNKPSRMIATEENGSLDNHGDFSTEEKKKGNEDSTGTEGKLGDQNESEAERNHVNGAEWPDTEVDLKNEEHKSQESQAEEGHSQRSREDLEDLGQPGAHGTVAEVLDEQPRTSYDNFRTGDEDVRTPRVLLSKESTHSPRVNEDDYGFTDGRKPPSLHNRFPPDDRNDRRVGASFSPDERKRPDRYYNTDHDRTRTRVPPDRERDLDRDRERERARARERERERGRDQFEHFHDHIRERDRDRDCDATNDREREHDREYERDRDRDKPLERDRERILERDRIRTRNHDWDRERDRANFKGRFSPDGGRKHSGESWPRRERSVERLPVRGRAQERGPERNRERLRDRDRERDRFRGSPFGRRGNRLSPDGGKRRRSLSRSRSPSPSRLRVSLRGDVDVDHRVNDLAKRRERFGNESIRDGRNEDRLDGRVDYTGGRSLDKPLVLGRSGANTEGGWGARRLSPPRRWSPKQRGGFERMRDRDMDMERERVRELDRDRDRERERERYNMDERVRDREWKWEKERGRGCDTTDVRGGSRGRWMGDKREREHGREIDVDMGDRDSKRSRLGPDRHDERRDRHDERRDRRSVHDRLGQLAIEYKGRPQRRSVHERLG